jgi:hypothetical protein
LGRDNVAEEIVDQDNVPVKEVKVQRKKDPSKTTKEGQLPPQVFSGKIDEKELHTIWTRPRTTRAATLDRFLFYDPGNFLSTFRPLYSSWPSLLHTTRTSFFLGDVAWLSPSPVHQKTLTERQRFILFSYQDWLTDSYLWYDDSYYLPYNGRCGSQPFGIGMVGILGDGM